MIVFIQNLFLFPSKNRLVRDTEMEGDSSGGDQSLIALATKLAQVGSKFICRG